MAGGDGPIPSGSVTFLFSDVVGSTRLWAADPDGMSRSLRIHDHVLRTAIETRSGFIFTTAGDSFAAAFERPRSAADAAVEIQAALAAADWDSGPSLLVRIGIHLGTAEERHGDYFGHTVNTTARLEAAGHGGQILISDAVKRATEIVTKDLGEHRLRDIDVPVRIHQVGHATFPPLRGVGTVNLPVPRTMLFGREETVAEVRHLLGRHQLVTLTGVGGCGKTRLAVEVAHSEVPDCPGGVWFVDLSSVAHSNAVPGAFAAALDITTDSFSPAQNQIATYLEQRTGLLVVDNCEHLIGTTAGLLEVVLDRCRSMRVLATSREPLAIDGEVPFRVPSLALGPRSAAVDLFIDRAIIAADGFHPDDSTRLVVADICDRLDGIPLAIELAAARTRSMGVAEIRDRLDDRFRFLSGGSRPSQHRQSTLETAVQWSYDLLGPVERSMLRRLSVFQGGFDLDDVSEVTDLPEDKAIDLVDALVAKSLINTSRDSQDHVRHHLLETIRLFAMERLTEAGERSDTRNRHLDHFLTEPAVRNWGAWQQRHTRRRVFQEFDNLRSAATWALESGRADAVARIASSIHDALFERGEAEVGIAWLQESKSLDTTDHVRVLAATAFLRANTFDLGGAESACRSAIDVAAGQPVDSLPWVHLLLSQVHMMSGEVRKARLEIRRALEIAPATPSCDLNTSNCLLYSCLFDGIAGEFDLAVADADKAINLSPDYGFRDLIEALRALALQLSGEYREADRAVRSFVVPTHSAWEHANTIVAVIVESRTVGPELATRHLAALATESVPKRPMTVGDWLAGFAYLATERGDYERAREIIVSIIAPVLVALEVEVFARVLDWSADSRFDQYLGFLRNNPSDERVGRALEHQPRLIAAEIALWS